MKQTILLKTKSFVPLILAFGIIGMFSWNIVAQLDLNIPDFVVNDDIFVNVQREPFIAGYSGQGFHTGWLDNRALTEHYFIRRFSSNGTPGGSDQQCTFSQESALERNLKIIMNPLGQSVIIWENHRYYYSQIWHRTYNERGSALSSSVSVDDPYVYGNHTQPDAAFFADGKMAIVWVDDRDSTSRVFGRFLDDQFSPMTDAQPLTDSIPGRRCENPAIITLGSSRFVLAWISRDDTLGHCRLMIRSALFGSDTLDYSVELLSAPSGSILSNLWIARHDSLRFLLSYSIGNSMQRNVVFALLNQDLTPAEQPWIAMHLQGPDSSKEYSISYSADQVISLVNEDQDGTVQLQRWSFDGTPLSVQIDFNPEHEDERLYSARVFATPESLSFVWVGIDSVGRSDIFSRVYLANGSPAGPRVRVNTDLTRQDQDDADVGALPERQMLFVYSDARTSTPTVYLIVYDSLGRALMESRPVPADTFNQVRQWTPALDVNPSGRFAVVWRDERNFNPDIYLRIFDEPRQPRTGDIPAQSLSSPAYQRYPDVAIDDEGRVIAVWMDGRFDEDDVYVRVFDANGLPLGPEVPVAFSGDHYTQSEPKVSMVTADLAMIVWKDERQGNADINGRFWSTATGQPVGAPFRVNDDISIGRQESPAVGGNRHGLAAVAYADDHTQNSRTDVYIRYYAPAGPIDSAFCASRFDHPREHSGIVVTVDESGRTAICWRDRGQIDNDIYAIELRGTLDWTTPESYRVNGTATPAPGTQHSPQVAILPPNSIVYVWTDERAAAQSGRDVVCNVRQWFVPPTAADEPASEIPQAFLLSDAFPNPFNSSTAFTLTLPAQSHVDITLFDLLGREVTPVYRGELPAGSHQFVWNGSAFTSQIASTGIYFLRARSRDHVESKKLLLLK